MTPSEWGAKFREYPETSGVPGPRDPELTRYVIPFCDEVHKRVYKRCALVISGQSGKSEALLDIIGQRLYNSPVPILYTGPTRNFLIEQWEPRIDELLTGTPLRNLISTTKRSTKTKKVISGVNLRLAHGGSSSALKSDPFGMCVTDEADELLANVKGAGDPISLIDVRGDTYADFVHAIVSTPSKGTSDTEIDELTGLEFWVRSEDNVIESKVWQVFETGTMHHWAWPCPHCNEFFVPRFKCLSWEKPKDERGNDMKSDPMLAHKTAHLVCPKNGCIIHDESKEWMNNRAVAIAKGQWVTKDGQVEGDPPDTWTFSLWVSGLCSPFVSWNERAARYVEAVRSGDQEQVKTVINGGFAELYAPGGGEVPEASEIKELRVGYQTNDIPEGVRILLATVDVQKDRLVYVVRGWGVKGTSWLIRAAELYGDTAQDDVWLSLDHLLEETWDGIPIRFALVDSGYRPGKKELVPHHRVYEFAKRYPNRVRAVRGASNVMRKPILTNKIDITLKGKDFKKGLTLSTLDTDFFKSWVHERIRWESEIGAWNLPIDVTDDYCRQIVSEARLKTPSGKVRWVQRSKENHFLDCESMQAAGAMMLNLFNLPDGPPARISSKAVAAQGTKPDTEAESQERKSKPQKRPGWLDQEGSYWDGS